MVKTVIKIFDKTYIGAFFFVSATSITSDLQKVVAGDS